MFKRSILLMSMAAVSGMGQSGGAPLVTMQELTVPPERLPPGCMLSPAQSVRLEGNRVLVRNWAGLRIPTNPWAGSDAPLIASIRERVDGPVLMPDAPPFTARESARYRLHLAEGVEEAYAAVYTQDAAVGSDPRELIVVYGLRFHDAQSAVDGRNRGPGNPRITLAVIGPVIAVVHGDGGQCFEAVGAHLKSLGK